MRELIKEVSSLAMHSAAFAKFVALLERADAYGEHPNLLRVLTYHRVDEPEARPLLYPRVTVTPAAFEAQMRYLAAHYAVISMPELLETCQTGTTLPPRAVLITFDDAYCDFAQYAWPILQRYQLPVTLFVPTAFPDQPERAFWWDWLHQAVSFTDLGETPDTPLGRLPLTTQAQRYQAFSRLRDYVKTLPHHEAMDWVAHLCGALGAAKPAHAVLGWEALRQLARQGVTLGAHTRTHPLVNRLSLAELRAEVIGSRQDLQREIGSSLPIFAYPSGGLNEAVVQALAEAGFRLAFTTRRGINDLARADHLQLRRINVGPGTTLTGLRAQLLPWSMHFSSVIH
jgi:peptidoglycan/xylan/chitin deacetylase (PgdA/CDA1 family)